MNFNMLCFKLHYSLNSRRFRNQALSQPDYYKLLWHTFFIIIMKYNQEIQTGNNSFIIIYSKINFVHQNFMEVLQRVAYYHLQLIIIVVSIKFAIVVMLKVTVVIIIIIVIIIFTTFVYRQLEINYSNFKDFQACQQRLKYYFKEMAIDFKKRLQTKFFRQHFNINCNIITVSQDYLHNIRVSFSCCQNHHFMQLIIIIFICHTSFVDKHADVKFNQNFFFQIGYIVDSCCIMIILKINLSSCHNLVESSFLFQNTSKDLITIDFESIIVIIVIILCPILSPIS